MKVKIAILLLTGLLVGVVGCTDSGTPAKTSPSGTPGIGQMPSNPTVPPPPK
jgi:hypothetical protein